jgi:hypothetical protein
MRRSLIVFLCVLSVLAITGCKRGADHVVKKQYIPDSQRAKVSPWPTPVRFEVVPSKGTCAPKADNLTIFGSCCNDKPCIGQCVKLEDGQIGCACFGVKGGCPEGLVCSKIRRGCVTLLEAQLP